MHLKNPLCIEKTHYAFKKCKMRLRPVLVGDENANKINQKTRFRFFGGSHCLSYENVKLIFRFKFSVPPIAYRLQNS